MDADRRFLALHTLRVMGMASAGRVAEATGLTEQELRPVLDRLVVDEHAKERAGAIGGFRLTPVGRQAHLELLGERVTADERAGVANAYEAFLPANAVFKQCCTAWQLRPGPDGSSVVNDHSDAEHDAGVIGELESVHKQVVDALAPAVAASPRFGLYPVRLASALEGVLAGHHAAFAQPMSGSYHDVWMELHEDFLLTLGRERSDADGH